MLVYPTKKQKHFFMPIDEINEKTGNLPKTEHGPAQNDSLPADGQESPAEGLPEGWQRNQLYLARVRVASNRISTEELGKVIVGQEERWNLCWRTLLAGTARFRWKGAGARQTPRR